MLQISILVLKNHECSRSVQGGSLTHGNNYEEQDIYVVKSLCKPLIGHSTITALQLMSRVNTIDSVRQQIMDHLAS